MHFIYLFSNLYETLNITLPCPLPGGSQVRTAESSVNTTCNFLGAMNGTSIKTNSNKNCKYYQQFIL